MTDKPRCRTVFKATVEFVKVIKDLMQVPLTHRKSLPLVVCTNILKAAWRVTPSYWAQSIITCLTFFQLGFIRSSIIIADAITSKLIPCCHMWVNMTPAACFSSLCIQFRYHSSLPVLILHFQKCIFVWSGITIHSHKCSWISTSWFRIQIIRRTKIFWLEISSLTPLSKQPFVTRFWTRPFLKNRNVMDGISLHILAFIYAKINKVHRFSLWAEGRACLL